MVARSPRARVALAALSLAIVVPACKHKERFDDKTAQPVRGDPQLGITIEMNGTAAHKPSNGDLSVPIRIRNDRNEAVLVSARRSQVELTTGARVRCRDDETVTIHPGDEQEFRWLWGDRSQPVSGASFRVYLWIEGARTGLVEYVPPLVIDGGGGAFAYPARPFSRDPSTGRPLDQEFPPPSGPRPTEPGAAKPAFCPACGEPCPIDAAKCPHCGTPK